MDRLDELALIAYDGSAPARDAVAQAARLLSARRVIVLTVSEEGLAFVPTPTGMVGGGSLSISPTVVNELHDVARQHAERVAREGAQLARSVGLDAEALALTDVGGVGDAILGVARDRHPAVIVIGSHGLGGLLARLQGSTASHLLRHAECPVLAVHPEQDER